MRGTTFKTQYNNVLKLRSGTLNEGLSNVLNGKAAAHFSGNSATNRGFFVNIDELYAVYVLESITTALYRHKYTPEVKAFLVPYLLLHCHLETFNHVLQQTHSLFSLWKMKHRNFLKDC